jgi:hypothetical protein
MLTRSRAGITCPAVCRTFYNSSYVVVDTCTDITSGVLAGGQSCTVKCQTGATSLGGTTAFTCSATGQLTATPTLQCQLRVSQHLF